MQLNDILALSPQLESAVRNSYWRMAPLVRWYNAQKAAPKTAGASDPGPVTSLARAIETLRSLGVGRGDLLVVHSAYRPLRGDGAKPDQIIDALLELIGPTGTLAMPAIPAYAEEGDVEGRMTRDLTGVVCTYDPKRTAVWTGALPLALRARANAARSLHPLNSMVAVGPLAAPMMEHNLEGDRPAPCGPNSSWKFCADHGAKLIGLGTELPHNLTMIHVAEDSNPNWPVAGWHRERVFKIVADDGMREVVVRERYPKWAMYFAERTLAKQLCAVGIRRVVLCDGVTFEIAGARELVDFLNARNRRGYPYYLLPRSALR